MMTRREVNTALSSGILIAASPGLGAQERALKQLPPARVEGGKPLVEALRLRRSIREYSERSLPPQVLSDLLWAAFGINRPSGDRTAPYWRHIMVIDVYAAMADGVWLYDPKRHTLLPHLMADIRRATGLQEFVATAPLNLVYVAHGDRMKDISQEERRLYASVDTGFIGQNVYLFCASEGLEMVPCVRKPQSAVGAGIRFLAVVGLNKIVKTESAGRALGRRGPARGRRYLSQRSLNPNS